jgi:unsaturated rhamnogalacturonyl hydrolase
MRRNLAGLAVLSRVLAALVTGAPGSGAWGQAEAAERTIDRVSVTLVNPLAGPRPSETVVVTRAEIVKVAPSFDITKALVVDAHGAPVLSQLVDMDADEAPDQIVFQTNLGARETKTFELRLGQRPPASRAEFKVYGRFVRERHDDFAWENDLVAHRVYGTDLETYKKDPLVSSGVDVWVKRVPKLIANDWYLTGDYHRDLGEGADFYSVAKSRGCGGLGVWAGGKLAVSRNFTSSRVLASGPIRLVFELSYAAWDAGSARVAEVKRVTLDAGSHFNRFESTFTAKDRSALSVGVGIAKHPGNLLKVDVKPANQTPWMAVWEPLDGGKSGHLGCAVALSPGSKAEAQGTDGDYLLVTASSTSGPLVYYVGTAWDRASGLADITGWTKEVQSLGNRLAAPVKTTLASSPASP